VICIWGFGREHRKVLHIQDGCLIQETGHKIKVLWQQYLTCFDYYKYRKQGILYAVNKVFGAGVFLG
jgi:hypothetical protein